MLRPQLLPLKDNCYQATCLALLIITITITTITTITVVFIIRGQHVRLPTPQNPFPFTCKEPRSLASQYRQFRADAGDSPLTPTLALQFQICIV